MGARYRLEVTDLGMGVTPREMLKMLLSWGYQVSREACQELHTLYLILIYLSINHLCIYLITSYLSSTHLPFADLLTDLVTGPRSLMYIGNYHLFIYTLYYLLTY